MRDDFWGRDVMKSSFLIKILIGLAIFLMVGTWQIKKAREYAPNLSDFSWTTDISGVSSYLPIGRIGLNRISGGGLYCGATYAGGGAPCAALAKLPEGSEITASIITLNTYRGTILYAMNIKFNSQEIYEISPREALRNWWTGSCIKIAIFSMLSIVAYSLILIVFT
ncbi:hypothetical protein IHE49_01995 [Rhodanobacter sp. 7MK24]|uniref:hypothetical protein n=1 Tax=Rhodanobacter sp. 7MK24 TaxID=2775922 RepID=UPI00177E456C|nr:hypothetical protein [Rhodanobacter sp. 7MK24]MBD8879247.1 hypothetical protein [Rhodanobacter sp. 7MK24]